MLRLAGELFPDEFDAVFASEISAVVRARHPAPLGVSVHPVVVQSLHGAAALEIRVQGRRSP